MEPRFNRTRKTPPDKALREQAESLLRTGSSDAMPVLSEDVPKLVHELQVHHVELEMQNEELRQAQQTLAEACDHYTQLYDFSPAGYVTLTTDGVIVEANLRFCTMIGVHRKLVLQQPFHNFVAPQDWDIFRRHCLEVVASGTTRTCRIRLLPKDGHPLIMQLESMSIKNTEHHAVHIEIAMLDMTQREEAEMAVRESQRKVQETAAKLVTAQDEERRRIARDLHDDYCQRLTAAILQVSILPKKYPGPWNDPARQLQPMKALLTGLLADLRKLSHELHPEQTLSKPLNDILRTCLADFEETAEVAVQFEGPLRPLSLSPAVTTCLLRLTQETLANVRKHAHARRVWMTVTCPPEGVELVIKDDGQGFVPEAVDGSHHLGLTSMRERVAQLGGTITIASRPGAGTTISIRIPIPSVPDSPEQPHRIDFIAPA